MRTLAFCVVSLIMVAAAPITLAKPSVPSSRTVVCPKCGKVHHVCPKCGKVHATGNHARHTTAAVVTPSTTVHRSPATSQSIPVRVVSAQTPVAATSALRAVAGVTNVLAALNAQRARQGISILRYDPQLQVVAQRRAQKMAATGLKDHPPGSFSPGRYEGVGWSSSYSPSGVSACYTSDSRMTHAGAAMVKGRDGVYFAVVYR